MMILPPMPRWRDPDEVPPYLLFCFELLGLAGWSFRWDHAVRRMGCCCFDDRRISLSRYFAEACLPEHPERLLRIVLHELAHALAWVHDQHTRHGEPWRRWCAELGIEGERARSRVEDFTPPHLRRASRFVLCHDETGEIFRYYRRQPRRSAQRLRRFYIPGRQEETLGHLVVRKLPPERG